jgi:hypothetical protein
MFHGSRGDTKAQSIGMNKQFIRVENNKTSDAPIHRSDYGVGTHAFSTEPQAGVVVLQTYLLGENARLRVELDEVFKQIDTLHYYLQR